MRPIHSSAQLLHESMHYRDALPPADLRQHVVDFWQIQTRSPTESVPSQLFPSPYARIRFMIWPSRVQALLYGPSSSPHRKGLYVSTQVSFGASLAPEGVLQVLGYPLHEFENTRIDLDLLWPNEIESLKDRLVDAPFSERVQVLSSFLRGKVTLGKIPKSDFVGAYRRLVTSTGTASITDICRTQGVSHRTIDRYFRDCVGLTPKQVARVVRLQSNLHRVCANPRTPDWTGYSDQSHWIREFKALVGLPPQTYAAQLSELHKFPGPYWDGITAAHYEGETPNVIRFKNNAGEANALRSRDRRLLEIASPLV